MRTRPLPRMADLVAFELTTRHEQRIYSLAYRILCNPHDAEDVTQQAFLSAVENLSKFREESSFATRLYRIATLLRSKSSANAARHRLCSKQPPSRARIYDSIPHPEYIADWKQSLNNSSNPTKPSACLMTRCQTG